jgi:hypothetical protein
MFKKIFGIFVLMFLMAIAIPVLAQRYNSCDRRGNERGRYDRRYDRDRNRGNSYYRQDNGRRNRRSNYSYGSNYGGNYGGYYAPAYYPQTYYAPSYPSYYVVRRRPVRAYNNYGYRPRYRGNRGRISFSIGF